LSVGGFEDLVDLTMTCRGLVGPLGWFARSHVESLGSSRWRTPSGGATFTFAWARRSLCKALCHAVLALRQVLLEVDEPALVKASNDFVTALQWRKAHLEARQCADTLNDSKSDDAWAHWVPRWCSRFAFEPRSTWPSRRHRDEDWIQVQEPATTVRLSGLQDEYFDVHCLNCDTCLEVAPTEVGALCMVCVETARMLGIELLVLGASSSWNQVGDQPRPNRRRSA